MAQPTIRSLTPADLDAVAAIYAHYVAHSVATFDEVAPSAAEWWAKAESSVAFLVAELDGAVAGFAYASAWRPKPAYRHSAEDTIYLHPDAVGRGTGRALLDALVRACDSASVRTLVAVIAESGDGASAALHRRVGFAPVGTLRAVGFKHGRWIDTTLWQRFAPM